MITLAQALKVITESLVEVSETPKLDAQTLLAHHLGQSRAWILSHPEEFLSKSTQQTFHGDIEKLKKGLPLPYILGHWEFYGLDFTITQDTLIPRPETELLVDQALDWLDRHPDHRQAADIGTGSGCIAITLAKINPDLSVIASDMSFPALKVTSENSSRHMVANRVHLLQGDLLLPVEHRFDLICANLPYIPTEILPTLKVSLGEPDLALDGGLLGLDLIGRFLDFAPDQIAPGGCLLLEIENPQSAEVQRLAHNAFPSAEIIVQKDLAGLNRLLKIQLPGNS